MAFCANPTAGVGMKLPLQIVTATSEVGGQTDDDLRDRGGRGSAPKTPTHLT
jgi:hypothetical protein